MLLHLRLQVFNLKFEPAERFATLIQRLLKALQTFL